ncbi:MAG: SDR family oxidoreductase [Proteobacteria bacterium]|nr:SDR family oxidoreductase [Pseudomonadota bacterium]
MAPAETRPGEGTLPLQGRRMVITGAARGLGRALALVAAAAGARVVLTARTLPALAAAAGAVEARSGRTPEAYACDLGEPGSVQAACRQILAADPVVDVLINNGAPWLPGALEALDDGQIAATIAAAVTGTVLITKGLLPGLRRSAAADVLSVVSTAALSGRAGDTASAPFAAAKHAQAGFSARLGAELRGAGIRFSAVYPPDFDDSDPLDAQWDEVRGAGRRLSNREVVAAILFAIGAPRVCAYPVIELENLSAP